MSSMYPRPEGSLRLREKFRYGSEVAYRNTYGDDLSQIIETHTEIEPSPVRTNLRNALSGMTIGSVVEFGWSTYTLLDAYASER